MSTLVGSLIEALGTKMATAFPGYSIIYGMPVPNGIRVPTGNAVRIHYMQERGTYSGSQAGGVVRVSPMIAITVEKAYSSDSTTLATHKASIDTGADLRQAVADMILKHLMGTAPITAFAGQALWISAYMLTPSVLDIGPGQSTESVTAEFTFNFSNTYEGR